MAGCTTLTAPDEAADLADSTGDLSAALRETNRQLGDALLAGKREDRRINVLQGGNVVWTDACGGAVDQINANFEDFLLRPYDSVHGDTIFRELRAVEPCGWADEYLKLDSLDPPEAVALPAGVLGSVGSGSLTGAARQLDAYTKALVNIATGESSSEVDAAQEKLVAAGKGFLDAVHAGNGSNEVLDLVANAIGSLVARNRNRTTREFLEKYDQAIPLAMERLGTGARLAVLTAAHNRARAASALSDHGNLYLNAPSLVIQGQALGNGTTNRMATPERMRSYDDLIGRLNEHNTAFVALRSADPMEAARAFAESHHALLLVYQDPRADRAALAEGLAKFAEAAAALKEALDAAEDDD